MVDMKIRRDYNWKMIVFLALLDNKINRSKRRTPTVTEDKQSQRSSKSQKRNEFTQNDISDYETGGRSLREHSNRAPALPRQSTVRTNGGE